MSKARDFAELLSSTGIFADGEVSASEVTNLHTVATSGSYNDLGNTPNLHTVAISGSYNDLGNTPNLHTVAISGSYADLSNTPSATALLTDIKTVDGASSGLDADLLDGQEGSYYTSYTDTAVANIVDSAPGTLDTLNELAAALGDDANFSTTITNSIATKLPLSGGTMTGAINFVAGQTFDGRDVSADGSKLDGIETGATADQTKADIDALGINAATLDGVDSSQFLRSDANDTMTATLTVDNELAIANPSNTTHFNYLNGGTNYIRGTTYMDGTFDLNGNTITDVGTLYVNGLIEGQGDVAIGGGSGYGYFKGYTANWNHFVGSRMTVSGSTSSPTVSGGHHCSFVEYLNTDTSGFWFKSSHTGSYTNIAHIGPSYTTIYSGNIKLEGTGRIEGIDTVSAGTDAANKNYVDNAIATQSSGTSYASIVAFS